MNILLILLLLVHLGVSIGVYIKLYEYASSSWDGSATNILVCAGVALLWPLLVLVKLGLAMVSK